MRTEAIYKIEITSYPDDRDDWQPEGWDESDMGGRPFYWPTTNRLYRSRSAAVARQRLIESYGATTVLLVSELAWQDDRAVRTHRRIEKAHERAEKLRRKADLIMAMATKLDEAAA